MPGPSRSTQRGGPSTRRDGAQRQRRTRRQPAARQTRRVSYSRRVGIAAALVLLVGGSIAFASQSLDHGSKPAQLDPGPPPPPPLTILQPRVDVTRAKSVDLTAIPPINLRSDQQYSIRIFVNGQQIARMDLPDKAQFTLSNVPLVEGLNSISTTLVGQGGESSRSAAATITRDDVAPNIQIIEPKDTVYTETETLVGSTEPGADIHITDGAGQTIDSAINSDGRFTASLDLHEGDNNLILRSTDLAGNQASTTYTVVRATSAAAIDLTVTPTDVYTWQLPATVQLSVDARDELGRAVADGTQVIFGISPPNRETTTYTATISNGRAHFSGLTLESGDATGSWLATALVTLPSGIQLRADASFNLRAGAPKSPGPH